MYFKCDNLFVWCAVCLFATAVLYSQPISLSLNQSLFRYECLCTLRTPINVKEQEDAELLPHTKRNTINTSNYKLIFFFFTWTKQPYFITLILELTEILEITWAGHTLEYYTQFWAWFAPLFAQSVPWSQIIICPNMIILLPPIESKCGQLKDRTKTWQHVSGSTQCKGGIDFKVY